MIHLEHKDSLNYLPRNNRNAQSHINNVESSRFYVPTDTLFSTIQNPSTPLAMRFSQHSVTLFYFYYRNLSVYSLHIYFVISTMNIGSLYDSPGTDAVMSYAFAELKPAYFAYPLISSRCCLSFMLSHMDIALDGKHLLD